MHMLFPDVVQRTSFQDEDKKIFIENKHDHAHRDKRILS
jgi:hypothetical protein